MQETIGTEAPNENYGDLSKLEKEFYTIRVYLNLPEDREIPQIYLDVLYSPIIERSIRKNEGRGTTPQLHRILQ